MKYEVQEVDFVLLEIAKRQINNLMRQIGFSPKWADFYIGKINEVIYSC